MLTTAPRARSIEPLAAQVVSLALGGGGVIVIRSPASTAKQVGEALEADWGRALHLVPLEPASVAGQPILHQVARQLGLSEASLDSPRLLTAIQRALTRHPHVPLIFFCRQADQYSIRDLNLLGLVAGMGKIQSPTLVLWGASSLGKMLRQPDLKGLRQRVVTWIHPSDGQPGRSAGSIFSLVVSALTLVAISQLGHVHPPPGTAASIAAPPNHSAHPAPGSAPPDGRPRPPSVNRPPLPPLDHIFPDEAHAVAALNKADHGER